MTSGDPAPGGTEQDLRSVLDAAGLGTFDLDTDTREVRVDRATRTAFGLSHDRDVFPVDDLLAVIHPDDLPVVERALAEAIREEGPYSVEHRVRLHGQERWLDIHGTARPADGRSGIRLIGAIRDSTELRLARDQAARVLEHVREALLSLDPAGRISYTNTRAEQMLHRSREQLIGHPFLADAAELLGPAFADVAAPGAAPPLVVEEYSETLRTWVELRVHEHAGGFTAYLTDVSARRATSNRARRLQQIAAALARSLTSEEVTRAALEHAVSGVGADSAGALVVDVERHEMQLVAGLEELGPDIRARWSRLPLSASTPLNLAVETGAPQLLTRADMLDHFPNLARDVEAIGAAYYALIPMVTAGQPLGVIGIGWMDRERISDDELAFLQAVAAQCAQALERARLFEQQQRIAESLQRSLLPQELPEVPRVDLGARYLAGAAGLQVGGDWYDVIPLLDGRVAIALGDVMGKGLPAAAAMGQVRYALRAFATLDASPATVLGCLDDFFEARDADEIVTLVYGVLDPRHGTLVWSNAGHPPPVLVGGQQPRTLSTSSDGTPLGVRSDRRESTLQLDPRDSLLLYSDGVVESRTRPVGDGVLALLEVAGQAAAAGSSADDLAGRVLSGMLGDAVAEDDATLLSVRWAGRDATAEDDEPADVAAQAASTKLRPEALASSSARRFVRDLLGRWSLPDLIDSAELCVSELVTNAVLHARTPIRLEVRVHAGVLHVDVCDNGGNRIDLPPKQEPGESLESGRGLYIVQALSQRTGVRTQNSGTCIWFELDLPVDGGSAEHGERADLL